MNTRRPIRLWNRLILGSLVLLVTGTTLFTVADSATAEGKVTNTATRAGAP
jgi:hypothetical protein